MGDRLEYTVLTRLLTLNNQVHDLENQLMTESVPSLWKHPGSVMTSVVGNRADGVYRIAEMQDRIYHETQKKPIYTIRKVLGDDS